MDYLKYLFPYDLSQSSERLSAHICLVGKCDYVYLSQSEFVQWQLNVMLEVFIATSFNNNT